jgi:hypothetical protein
MAARKGHKKARKTSHKKKARKHSGVTLSKLNTRVTHLERFIGTGPR